MAETVKLPGMGDVPKKEATIFGILFIVVIGVVYYRYHKANTTATTTATTTAANTAGIDTATGYPTGSPQDVAALAAQQNSAYGYGGGVYDTGYGTGGPSTPGTGDTTNAQWAQQAENYLANTIGADTTTVAAALGRYLTGQPLAPSEITIVEQAIAFNGYPPQSGSGGFPPSFNAAPTPPPAQNPGTLGVQPAIVPATGAATHPGVTYPSIGPASPYRQIR